MGNPLPSLEKGTESHLPREENRQAGVTSEQLMPLSVLLLFIMLILHRQGMTRTLLKKAGSFSSHCTRDLALRDISRFSHDLPAHPVNFCNDNTGTSSRVIDFITVLCVTPGKKQNFGQTLCPETGQCCERDQAFSWIYPSLSSFSSTISLHLPSSSPIHAWGLVPEKGSALQRQIVPTAASVTGAALKTGKAKRSWKLRMWGGKAPGDNGGGLYLVLLERLFSCSNVLQGLVEANMNGCCSGFLWGQSLHSGKLQPFSYLEHPSMPEHLCVHHTQSEGEKGKSLFCAQSVSPRLGWCHELDPVTNRI